MKYYIISENADQDAINEPTHFKLEVSRKTYIHYKNIQKDYFGYTEKLIRKIPKIWAIADEQGNVRATREEERKCLNNTTF